MTDQISNVLHAVFGAGRGAVKAAAVASEASPETTRNWFERRNAMSLEHFVRLCQSMPEFRAEARRLLAMDADLDPALTRAYAELESVVIRRIAGRHG